MYTSISPNNERFGFSAAGKFKCAYKLERTIIAAGLIIIGILLVLLIISAVFFAGLFDANGTIKGGVVVIETAPGSQEGTKVKTSPGFVNVGLGILSMEFFGIVLGVLVVIFALVIVFLHAGRYYNFKADENSMTVIYPDGKEESFLYKDVMAVLHEDRKRILASSGLTVTIKTRYKDYVYFLIHTPLSKANGIYETPFNIVRERAELASQWETVTKYGRGL